MEAGSTCQCRHFDQYYREQMGTCVEPLVIGALLWFCTFQVPFKVHSFPTVAVSGYITDIPACFAAFLPIAFIRNKICRYPGENKNQIRAC